MIGAADALAGSVEPVGAPNAMPCKRKMKAPSAISSPNAERQRQPRRPLKSRAHNKELAHEHAHGRQPDNGEDAEDEAPAEQRMGGREPADLGNLLRALDLGDLANRVEDRRFGEAVHRHVQERGEIGERTADPESEDDNAHVLDRGVGEHAFHVFAAIEHEGGEHHRNQAERHHQRPRRDGARIGVEQQQIAKRRRERPH